MRERSPQVSRWDSEPCCKHSFFEPDPFPKDTDPFDARVRRRVSYREAQGSRVSEDSAGGETLAMIPHHLLDSDSSSTTPMRDPVERTAPEDRRKGARRPHRLSVKLLAAETSDAASYVGLTENLSQGGAFVATRAPCGIGSAIDLIIGLPQQKIVRARARVCWRRFASSDGDTTPGVGIRFERLSAEDADRIRDVAKA
jgi:uncharacterized protein (TIGR02266 family)